MSYIKSNRIGELKEGDKVDKVLNKNSGFDTICKIAVILSGWKYSLDVEELKTGGICCFKYAPCSY